MNKIKNFLDKYYKELFIITGVIFFFSFIWVRFLRQRVPRDIPFHLTPWGLISLVFIIILYSNILRQIIKPSNNFAEKIPNKLVASYHKLYTPWYYLDAAIKSNKYTQLILRKIIITFAKLFDIHTLFCHGFIILLCIIHMPTLLLAIVWLLDIFYFNKIEHFYLFIILGIAPLGVRYLLFSMEQLIKEYKEYLDSRYIVKILSKDFEGSNYFWDIRDLATTDYRELAESTVTVTITYFLNIQTAAYKHEFTPYEFMILTKDYEEPTLFELGDKDYLEIIVRFNVITETFKLFKTYRLMKELSIIQVSSYLISWYYILSVSLHTLNLLECVILLNNMLVYLDKFIDMSW